MEDDDDFLAAVEADNKSDTPEEPKVEEAQAEPAKEPEAEPKADPTAETPAAKPEELVLTPEQTVPEAKPDEKSFAPIAALLDERDKRKAAEERLALYEQRQQAQQAPVPDPFEDPEGHAAWQQAQVGSALYGINLRFSERLATVQHGADKVKAAKEWGYQRCETDPYFNAKVLASDDPMGLVVTEYEREEIASKVTPDEFQQFQAWKAAQAQLQQQQQPGNPPAPQQASSIPPKSIASAPSAGDILTEPIQSDEEMFDEVVGNRK